MESVIINNNKYPVTPDTNTPEKDIDVEDSTAGSDVNEESTKSISPPPGGIEPATSETGNRSSTTESTNERHGHVNSFLKFSIQNILQQAAASSGASAAAAAVAAAASRRSSEIMQADMAAAVMSDLDMKRAMGTLPFW